MKKNLTVAILALVILISYSGFSMKTDPYEVSEEDKKEIKALKRSIPLILANEGWEAYEKLFSKN